MIATFIVWLLAGSGADPVDLPAVLDKARIAAGFERFRSFDGLVIREGVCHHDGVDGTCTIVSASDGRYVRRIEGPLGSTTGFDGRTWWMVDHSGMPRTLRLQDREVVETGAAVSTGRWLSNDAPVTLALDDARTDAKAVALSIRPKDGVLDATLLVDRTTWLPLSLIRRSVSGEETSTFEDWRRDLGFALPCRLTQTSNESTTVTEIRSIRRLEKKADDPFARITARPEARFDSALSPHLEVKRAKTGHFLVHPLVDGKDIGWFILDSGAGGMVIDKKAALDAALPAIGESVALGVGGAVKTRFRQGKALTLGPISMATPLYTELDLGFLSTIFGVPVGGIVGYDFFARAVVELDVDAATVDVRDPCTFALSGGSWQELWLDRNVPCVQGRFEGDREGLFRLDTGSAAFLIFHGPAVKNLSLLEKRNTSFGASGGVGGINLSREGEIEWFELAGRRFEHPRVGFSLADKGALADPWAIGNLGCGVLSSFRVVFDYPHERIAFVGKPSEGAK
ncbi:MAG: retropepsin-like domain-containing protein [Planctomycetes bacterium]|nr:retropepsin-like domain-containing protein [Planctomycetota bacterium]